MANIYTPSLNDIPGIEEYVPSLNDLPASQYLEAAASPNYRQEAPENSPQIQEEFSNPTNYPGFENLPKKERLERIAFSQFDPANQTALGGVYPPGAYESKPTRLVSSVLPTLFAPELKAALSLLPRTAINALSRIGAGTAGNIAYESPNIKSRQDLMNVASNSAKGNALLEGGLAPLRLAAGMAEVVNPINYARNKASLIKNEHDMAFKKMEENFKPINDKYNNYIISVTPKKYLNQSGIKRDNLFPDAQKYYDEFLSKPVYKNLVNFKSQIGRDWATLKPGENVRDLQQFGQYSRKLDDKIKNFLRRDKNSLNQYEIANKYAQDVYYPYLSTPTLRKISKGKFNAIYPEKMAKSLEGATERVVGQGQKFTIPENHPLRNHMRDLKNRLTLGDVAEFAIPTIAGGLAGGMIHPAAGLGGIAGGLGTGFGSKLLRSKLLEFPVVQSPGVQNVFKELSPAYYGIGRGLMEDK